MPEFKVSVDNDLHYMDESKRYIAGEFDTLEEAIAKCQSIVDEFISGADSMSDPKKFYESYVCFGEDPWIPQCDSFSAWDYAKERGFKIWNGKQSS